MKKAALFLALGFMGIQAAFFVSVAEAKVILSSPDYSVLSQDHNTNNWWQKIGSPLATSTVRRAVLAFSENINGAASGDIYEYTNDTYSSGSPLCVLGQNVGSTGTTTGFVIFDLVYHNFPGTDCVLSPYKFYAVRTNASSITGATQIFGSAYEYGLPRVAYGGSANSGQFDNNVFNMFFMLLDDTTYDPYAVLVPIAGFPTTGIGTSSVNSFCSSSFATSSGIFSDISNGVGYGLCASFAFLFVPTGTALNAFSFNAVQNKIPFSYYYDVSGVFTGLTSSSTQDFTPFSVNLAATGVGSTTPWGGILTNFTYLSTTTIMQYINPTLYALLFLLMRSAIWIAVLLHLYRRIIPSKAHAV